MLQMLSVTALHACNDNAKLLLFYAFGMLQMLSVTALHAYKDCLVFKNYPKIKTFPVSLLLGIF